MSMRGAPRRRSDAVRVSLKEFSWPRSVVATLRHCSLPWWDSAPAAEYEICGTPLANAKELGERDRLSVTAQYAAHIAFLQFAGMSDAVFDPAEWVVVRKRAQDCRLVRIAASRKPEDIAMFASLHEFATSIEAPPLDTLRQPWSRPEVAYAEIASKLASDIAADLHWTRCAAAGEIVTPGPESLQTLQNGTYRYSDLGVADSLAMLAAIDGARILTAGTTFPLQRFSALADIDRTLPGTAVSEVEAAERIAEIVSRRRTIVVVHEAASLDAASRRAVEIASQLHTATWLIPGRDDALPRSRFFIVSSRLDVRQDFDSMLESTADPRSWLATFVESPAFRRYLDRGDVPRPVSAFDDVSEPRRSIIAALALLGTAIDRNIAAEFMRTFGFEQPLEQLCAADVTSIDDGVLRFASDEMREHCAAHIPDHARNALYRAAAAFCEPRRRALLLFDGGDRDEAIRILESIEWTNACDIVKTLAPLPRLSLSAALAETLGDALIDCGKYNEAIDVASRAGVAAERLLARVERRRGDYAMALTRLTRMEERDAKAQLLLAELLRLAGRNREAAAAILDLRGDTEVDYERALISFEEGESETAWMQPAEYFSSRFATYCALRSADFATAATLSARALELATTAIERVDAWLDRVFTSFSAGEWDATRALALQALTAASEAQGDRASAAILYTLAFLAADDARWTTAEQVIKRLRSHFTTSADAERLTEIQLLDAHLDFSRGNFSAARPHAEAVYAHAALVPQIREAAALILDEIDWIEGKTTRLRSTGRAGNVEMKRRHDNIRDRRDRVTAATRSEKLQLFRAACRNHDLDAAKTIASELDLTVPKESAPADRGEFSTLVLAATAEYPYRYELFGNRWCFAVRNRLGHWSCTGPVATAAADLDAVCVDARGDWVRVSDRELLYFEGIESWSEPSRRALAATFSIRAEATRLRRLSGEMNEPRTATAIYEIVGESLALRSVFQMIDRVAKRDIAVCIVGESGTGKELVARAIQRNSSRRSKPFTTLNCAALPETLIESELFGHMRGAFTGADRDRVGIIETADGGTLFLDEVGELPMPAQAKLLRFLQDGEFRPVGDTRTRTADVRIISATNRKLETAVEEGTFREDLYYRLRGVEIVLPALRDRGDDVLLLANHFLAAERALHRSGPVALSSEVETLFRLYRWPGNVRELQNTIRGAHAVAGDVREVDVEHLPERLRQILPGKIAGTYQDAVTRFRRDLIEKSLLEASGNQNRAAAMLNISRQALAYQIRELGIMVQKRGSRADV